MDTVKYLRHVIRPGTLEVDEVATAALTNAKPPKNQTELRSFSGLSNVYRRFVPNYSHVAAPLSAFLKKAKPARLPQDLGEEARNAFDEHVKRIITPPVPALPREGLPYVVEIDTNDYQVGAALFHLANANTLAFGQDRYSLQRKITQHRRNKAPLSFWLYRRCVRTSKERNLRFTMTKRRCAGYSRYQNPPAG